MNGLNKMSLLLPRAQSDKIEGQIFQLITAKTNFRPPLHDVYRSPHLFL